MRPNNRPFFLPRSRNLSPLVLHPQRMNQPLGNRLRQDPVAAVQPLRGENMRHQRPRVHRAMLSERNLANRRQFAPQEQPVDIRVCSCRIPIARSFEYRDHRIDMREIGAGLRQARLVIRNRGFDFVALGEQSGDGANFGHPPS